jgi:hypothetical protein
MFVPPKAVPHAAARLSEAKSGFKLHGKIVPGGREVSPGDSTPWLGPTGNPQYCALLQVEHRTLWVLCIPVSPARWFQMLGIFDILARLSTANFALCSDPTSFLNPLYARLIYLFF